MNHQRVWLIFPQQKSFVRVLNYIQIFSCCFLNAPENETQTIKVDNNPLWDSHASFCLGRCCIFHQMKTFYNLQKDQNKMKTLYFLFCLWSSHCSSTLFWRDGEREENDFSWVLLFPKAEVIKVSTSIMMQKHSFTREYTCFCGLCCLAWQHMLCFHFYITIYWLYLPCFPPDILQIFQEIKPALFWDHDADGFDFTLNLHSIFIFTFLFISH